MPWECSALVRKAAASALVTETLKEVVGGACLLIEISQCGSGDGKMKVMATGPIEVVAVSANMTEYLPLCARW